MALTQFLAQGYCQSHVMSLSVCVSVQSVFGWDELMYLSHILWMGLLTSDIDLLSRLWEPSWIVNVRFQIILIQPINISLQKWKLIRWCISTKFWMGLLNSDFDLFPKSEVAIMDFEFHFVDDYSANKYFSFKIEWLVYLKHILEAIAHQWPWPTFKVPCW